MGIASMPPVALEDALGMADMPIPGMAVEDEAEDADVVEEEEQAAAVTASAPVNKTVSAAALRRRMVRETVWETSMM
jgi:hypothetical protein